MMSLFGEGIVFVEYLYCCILFLFISGLKILKILGCKFPLRFGDVHWFLLDFRGRWMQVSTEIWRFPLSFFFFLIWRSLDADFQNMFNL